MRTKIVTKILLPILPAMWMVGCASAPYRAPEKDGTYCFNPGRSLSRSKTCTTTPVPSHETEVKAREFLPVAEAGVLYVVRNRLEDSHHRLPISVDGRTPMITVPGTMMRFVVAPGLHRVVLEWKGRQAEIDLALASNEVAFVEVEGLTVNWTAEFKWYAPDMLRSQRRAASAKLIVDEDLREKKGLWGISP